MMVGGPWITWTSVVASVSPTEITWSRNGPAHSFVSCAPHADCCCFRGKVVGGATLLRQRFNVNH